MANMDHSSVLKDPQSLQIPPLPPRSTDQARLLRILVVILHLVIHPVHLPNSQAVDPRQHIHQDRRINQLEITRNAGRRNVDADIIMDSSVVQTVLIELVRGASRYPMVFA